MDKIRRMALMKRKLRLALDPSRAIKMPLHVVLNRAK